MSKIVEPGDLDEDLPPLVGEDGEEVPVDETVSATLNNVGVHTDSNNLATSEADTSKPDTADHITEEDVLRTTAALQAASLANKVSEAPVVTADEAMKTAMAIAAEPKPEYRPPSDVTVRMVKAITKDDFEECEDAIMQGADVNADCGAGMHAIHMSALRGEMFLTELLLAHGANVNERDLSGNTPLLYACHFYRQHGRGVQLTAQLLHHKADPFYRVKDGKLAGKSALDIMDKACREPNTDENVPRQMRAMIQLAMEGKEECFDAITKMWMNFKSQNKKLYQVSSKKDKYDYNIKNVDWVTPENAKNVQASAPVKLKSSVETILEEKYTDLTNYLFTDEGDKVKLYVTFPESAAEFLQGTGALQIDFEFQSFDLKLKTDNEKFRLRIDPLFGSIEVEQCKHRVSSGSRKVTLTLVKRHKNRLWPAVQKPR